MTIELVIWGLGALAGGMAVQLWWPVQVSLHHAGGDVLFIGVKSGFRDETKAVPQSLVDEIAAGRPLT